MGFIPASSAPSNSASTPGAPASDELEPRARAPWYRRWQVLLLSPVVALLGTVALWFVTGELSEWAFDAFVKEKRSQGYAITVEDFYQRARDDWHARRASTPGLQTAAVRLCQYGARVAELQPWEPREYIVELEDLRGVYPRNGSPIREQAAAIIILTNGDILNIPQDPVQEAKPWLDIHHCYVAGHWRRLLAMDCPIERPHESCVYPGLLTLHTNMTVYHCLIARYLRAGDVERAVSLWEFIFRKSAASPPVHWRGGCTLSIDAELLNFAMRSGLLKEEHIRRILRASFLTIEDLRTRRVWLIREDIAGMTQHGEQFREYSLPWPHFNNMGWESLEWPKSGELFALQMLPGKAFLLFHRNKMRHEEAYLRQIEAQAGTSRLDEIPPNTKEYQGDEYWPRHIQDDLAQNVNEMWAVDAALHNERYAILGFGLYRARTGRIPQKLEDFIIPEIQAKLIEMRYLELKYKIDSNTGDVRISCSYDWPGPLPPMMSMRNSDPDMVVYSPADKPLGFPLKHEDFPDEP
ncbi:MAG TPA: hypothetical protein VK970_07360 [Candidatus Methylacidiphilales bacterium]|nr:hypothetical protein [Candidatus Methylacidiphilales bacterium]